MRCFSTGKELHTRCVVCPSVNQAEAEAVVSLNQEPIIQLQESARKAKAKESVKSEDFPTVLSRGIRPWIW